MPYKIYKLVKHTFMLCFAAIFYLSTISYAAGDGPFNAVLSLMGESPTSITVSWRDTESKAEVLQLVEKTQYDKTGFTAAAEITASCKDISRDGSGVWRYEATSAELIPETSYAYRVGCEGNWSETYIFTTIDPTNKSLTFAYMGDIQTYKDTETEYALWGRLAESLYKRNPELSFAVLGGDIVDNGINTAMFDSFFKSASPVFSHIPLMAANGNHESNFLSGKPELYLDEFALPQNGPEGFKEEFYSFDAAGCHITVLNSWIYSSEQKLKAVDYERVKDWIKNDLASSTADWQVIVTHIPIHAVSSDKTAAAVKDNWAPIFEKYGVDIVFEGHQHVYSRSYPLYEDRVDYENGITYIMGNSGQKFYSSADESKAERTIYNTATYQLVRVDGENMTVQTCDIDGNELDYVSLRQRELKITREEYIETLWRGHGSPAPKEASPFKDSDSQAAAWAYESGLVYGYGDGRFGSDDKITGCQQRLILERMEAIK
jgi:hypothetical protein